MMPKVVEATERAVNRACGSVRMYRDEVSKLTRVEISYDTLDELRAWGRPGIAHYDDLTGRGKAITVRGVSYYPIYDFPLAWRIIAPAATTTGFGVAVEDGPPNTQIEAPAG